MAKKPEERVQTADELAAALLAIVKSLGSGNQSAGGAVSPTVPTPALQRSPALAPTEAFDAPASAGNPKAAARKKKPAAPDDDDTLEQALKALAPAPPRTTGRKSSNATAKSGRRPGSGVPSKVWIAGGALAAVLVLAGIVIKIRNKDGSVTEIKVPDGAEVEVVRDGDKPATPPVAPLPAAPETPPPLPAYLAARKPALVDAGQPLSPYAVVPRPASIASLRSWSIEPANHSGLMNVMAWSPRGDLIATAGMNDGSVRLWDRDGALVRVLMGHQGAISSLDFSADGSLLASGERLMGLTAPKSTARVWEVATGKCVGRIESDDWIEPTAFSPDGSRLAFANMNLGVMLFDLKTMHMRRQPLPNGNVETVAWSPDGTKFLSGTRNGQTHVWNADRLKQVGRLIEPGAPEGQQPGIYAAGWSPDGRWIATGCHDGKIRIWEAGTWKHLRTIDRGFKSVIQLSWSRDSRRLLVAAEGGPAFTILDTVEGKPLVTADPVYGSYVARWSRDETEVGCWNPNNQRLLFFDAQRGRLTRQGRGFGTSHSRMGSLAKDGQTIVCTTPYFQLQARTFDAETGVLARSDAIRGWGEVFVDSVPVPSPDGQRIAVRPLGARPADVLILDAANGLLVHRLSAAGEKPDSASVNGVRWSPDSARLAAPSDDGKARIWDVANGKLERELVGHEGPVRTVEWSPDGSRLATTGKDGTVRIWTAATGQLDSTHREFPEEPSRKFADDDSSFVHRLAWTADGKELWIALTQHATRLDIATGKFSPFENFSNGNTVSSLAVSPDGSRLLARENYGWTFLREADGTRTLLGQHLGWQPFWLPDNRRFAGFDRLLGRVVTFDTRAGRRLGTLYPCLGNDDGFDEWLCVGPDGHYRGSAKIDRHIVYVALHEDGRQTTHTPDDFQATFGWKNDPDKATLLKLPE